MSNCIIMVYLIQTNSDRKIRCVSLEYDRKETQMKKRKTYDDQLKARVALEAAKGGGTFLR